MVETVIEYKKRGRFLPRVTDNLTESARLLVGQELLFTYAGTMPEDESYAGQKTYLAHTPDGEPASMGWIPAEDIHWV